MRLSTGRRLIVIKTQIVKSGDRKPVFVIMDYEEYLRLKEIEEDGEDYYSALQIKMKNKKWKTHEELKMELGIKQV
jgi:hypothetical protein